MTHTLDPLLRPDSVAIIGASDTPSRIGGRPVHSMKIKNYQGKIYPVSPKWQTVQDLPAYSSIKEVPEAVDCAVIAVPARVAVDTIRDCAEHGVKAAVVFTSGFAELDDAGKKAQDQIRAIARDSGMRILGPNCLGVFTISNAWFGTFANAPGMISLPPGPVGIVSQSGAYGAHVFLVSQQRGVGSNYWVTTGNECDVDVAEVIAYYAQADDVKVIVAYAEGMQNAERICHALELARAAKKPVIFMKVGKTAVGARAAASHTASLAGADAVYDGVFRQYGVYRAETTEELVDIAYACQFARYPRSNKIAVQSISGGVGVQMADASVKYGLDAVPLPATTQKKLKDLIPFAGVRNPVDFTAQALTDPELMQKNVSLTIDEGDYDSHVIYLASVPASPFTGQGCRQIFSALREQYPDEIMLMSQIGPTEVIEYYEKLNYPCFEDPSHAVRALAALTHFGKVFQQNRSESLPQLPGNVMAAPATTVAEYKAKQILASAGIPVTREQLANSADQAVELWQDIAVPVVMKISSADILHKTEVGGIILNLNHEAAIRQGYITLLERAQSAQPDARIDGVLITEMISDGVETVLGVVRDPLFGPVVMFGLGGVFVEVLKDVTFRRAPFGIAEARRMIDDIRGRAMLDGVRGAPPADINALAQALSRLSVFATANADKITTIDINPFIVLERGAVAVDALLVTN